MNINEALSWRYATKQFDPTKKLTEEQLTTVTEALRLSASSYGLQPWKFIVISDPAIRQNLRKHSWDQAQVTDCSHLIVLCAKNSVTPDDVQSYVDLITNTRNVPAEKLDAYKAMMLGSIGRHTPETMRVWVEKQVYIALGTLLTACAVEQIDACPMEGIDPVQYDAMLGLGESGYHAVVACPVGFRASTDASAAFAKVRYPAAQVIEHR